MMEVVFAPQARIDMEELHASIARRSPASASLALADIRKAVNRLALFPKSGQQGLIGAAAAAPLQRMKWAIHPAAAGLAPPIRPQPEAIHP